MLVLVFLTLVSFSFARSCLLFSPVSLADPISCDTIEVFSSVSLVFPSFVFAFRFRVFLFISAYTILSDIDKRRSYDSGLAFDDSIPESDEEQEESGVSDDDSSDEAEQNEPKKNKSEKRSKEQKATNVTSKSKTSSPSSSSFFNIFGPVFQRNSQYVAV